MTEAQVEKARSVANTIATIAGELAPALAAGAIVTPPVAIGIAAFIQLTKVLVKLHDGVDPTPAELAHNEAEMEASNARMNAAAALALAQAEA